MARQLWGKPPITKTATNTVTKSASSTATGRATCAALLLMAVLGACASDPAANATDAGAGGGMIGASVGGRGGATGGNDRAGAGGNAIAADAALGTPDLSPADDATTRDAATGSADLRAEAGANAGTDATTGAADTNGATAWPVVTDYGARGPLPVTRTSNTGPGNAYDVFRPAQLDAARKHPIISWANGTLFDIVDYQKLLEHWASHGFIVIAAQTNTTAGGGTHKAGIDWMLAENARTGSPYLGAVDIPKIGAAGHSQGGGATIAAGCNKPGATGIVATLPLMPLLSFESDKTIVMQKAAPMLNINASMDNRDPNGLVPAQIFAGAQSPLVQASFIGIHEDAMNAAMLRPALAWFRLHLMGDEAARALFYPNATCTLCKDAGWKDVRHKNPP